MTLVAAYNDVRSACRSERQVLVILLSFGSRHSRTLSLPAATTTTSRMELATLGGDEPIEFRAEDDLAVFVLDRLREDESVGRVHDAQERPLGNAVRLKGGGDEG